MPKIPCPGCGTWIKVRSRTSTYVTSSNSRCRDCYNAGKGLKMCKGTNNRGNPCGKFSYMDSDYCQYHATEEE